MHCSHMQISRRYPDSEKLKKSKVEVLARAKAARRKQKQENAPAASWFGIVEKNVRIKTGNPIKESVKRHELNACPLQ